MRETAKQQLHKIQSENYRTYDRKRKAARVYHVEDLVLIKRTQFATESKLKSQYLGPYQIISAKSHDRYEVERIGDVEGLIRTSTSADLMKPWADEGSDTSSDDEEFEVSPEEDVVVCPDTGRAEDRPISGTAEMWAANLYAPPMTRSRKREGGRE